MRKSSSLSLSLLTSFFCLFYLVLLPFGWLLVSIVFVAAFRDFIPSHIRWKSFSEVDKKAKLKRNSQIKNAIHMRYEVASRWVGSPQSATGLPQCWLPEQLFAQIMNISNNNLIRQNFFPPFLWSRGKKMGIVEMRKKPHRAYCWRNCRRDGRKKKNHL